MAEPTSSTREAARHLGVRDTTMHKAERTGRITREPDGQWDTAKLRVQMRETADPQRSPLSGSTAAEGTPVARLKVAQLALKVEARRLALDESKGRLPDVATGNATIDEIASTMRDALLNWPARVAGVTAAELGVETHLLQTILQQHINELLTEASDRFDVQLRQAVAELLKRQIIEHHKGEATIGGFIARALDALDALDQRIGDLRGRAAMDPHGDAGERQGLAIGPDPSNPVDGAFRKPPAKFAS